MPTLRELTVAIQQRPGVRSVVVLGADGLVIETHDVAYDQTRPAPAHPENYPSAAMAPADRADATAARVPAVAQAARQLGTATDMGDARFVLLEFDDGYGVIMPLSSQAMLFVSAGPEVALADLLYDLRRHRAPMSALV